MSHHVPEHDPRSRFEDEGIPDLQDGTPQQQWAVDPQEAPLPADEPVAVEDFGTTDDEQIQGESLSGRLEREVSEEQPMFGMEEPAGRLVAPDEGTRADAEPDEVAMEAGPDAGGFTAEEAAMHVEPE
ncbi:hypothetical protein E1295_34040 [Nonomuraea mesophila]|uniref:DUF5709 domain-containing protein n=1 Tax=Nonomuraea mesophila TaxID=2530382 RepID=A0A4R5ETQ7_9ACTN|nr:DUF5709 domain-containing protein [Nonomuraea mesophila]TDE38067.1 hypothetical protein E1295_34040 [Nonomuraea mesophila]